jgi:transcriptional regulator with XRE-family HTH domain
MDTATFGEQDGRAMLAEFIRSRKITQAQFAREVGCSESHLSLVLKGFRGISFGLAKRISNATGGAVPVDKLPHAVLELVQTEAAE